MGNTDLGLIVRESINFILGVLLIIHSVFGNGSIDRVIELTVGLILIGVIPVDVFLSRFMKNGTPKN